MALRKTRKFEDEIDSEKEERIWVINVHHLSVKWFYQFIFNLDDIWWKKIELVFVSGAKDDVINRTCRVVIQCCAVSAH